MLNRLGRKDFCIRSAYLKLEHMLKLNCLTNLGLTRLLHIELPVFNNEQAGCTYYYSPLGIYNLGVVNQAHEYRNIDGSVEFDNHFMS